MYSVFHSLLVQLVLAKTKQKKRLSLQLLAAENGQFFSINCCNKNKVSRKLFLKVIIFFFLTSIHMIELKKALRFENDENAEF